MANEHSITNNPVFQNGGHPFTELFELLPELQRKISGNNISYNTSTETLKAIRLHNCVNDELFRRGVLG